MEDWLCKRLNDLKEILINKVKMSNEELNVITTAILHTPFFFRFLKL
jgi:hypothetical protein